LVLRGVDRPPAATFTMRHCARIAIGHWGRPVIGVRHDGDMADATEDDSLEDLAWLRLVPGTAASEVFVHMLTEGVDPRRAAIAVCVAAGSPRSQAELRLQMVDGIWELVEPGEEDLIAEALDAHGYFEPDAVLTEREHAIVANLNAAWIASGGIPSGYAVGISRDMRTGRLAQAFVRLEALGAVRWTSNTEFWTAMCRAADHMLDNDSAVDAARQRCFERIPHN
jgi:hypothetical protein